jgi:hypothetical protein
MMIVEGNERVKSRAKQIALRSNPLLTHTLAVQVGK